MNKPKVTVNNSGGIGFLGLLTIVFIVLKLTGYINWSWLWVLSPLWGGCLVGGTLMIIFLALAIWTKQI